MRSQSPTVALYGGSFDPPHIAHEAIVKALREKEFIDEVVVMPTFLNPFKSQSFADASVRLAWLREIFSEYNDVIVSSFEVDAAKKMPTIESVQYLLKKYTKVYLVIGADNLQSLSSWYKYEQLRELVTFIVVSRDSIEIPKEYISIELSKDVSSTELRTQIELTKIPKKIAQKVEHYYKQGNKCKSE